ncbi:hypothetical protein PENSTE_c005G02382 [Penicillium steckii]|uniref:Small nuclear ribonucleoprotein Prp3 C-terminal domain-containing protein n=1 Tax=Penicillium steckii TaxID=303698 RepID=A0A1V6TLH6_9EURO|nr:hypothetical protein PENSTE_c005G02382 [Penicillium steckii]
MATESSLILPPDIMESQLSTIDLLTAMFPSPGEMEIPESTAEHVERLREWCQNETPAPPSVPSSLPLSVFLPVSDGEKSIQVNISVPLQCEDANIIDQPPPSNYSLRQPDWMSKAEFSSMAASFQGVDSLEALDDIQNRVNDFLESKKNEANATEQRKVDKSCQGPIVRVWFYFPSLSTRKKRDDMVNLAPSYSLTGFVLAGKPGVLCLEGMSADIDSYMSFIKTHSWGDIPSHQKKVSERFRETQSVQRVFTGMEEITDTLGERSGQRANRGDMQALEAWLGSKGLQTAFEKVIF